ncbi:YhgE/Pip family protein [Mycoplasma sp. P36-A1]|uniref:YhgE/Pip domain-containing protein n=1 Tax=Mycoplasma sp. P36-A1 TaxID=3252900 RepID=UPI003C300253
MKKLKKIAKLYKQDWKRLTKAPLALILVIALMIIPSLYAWFNIEALWDPYANTGNLKVAVYSDDSGSNFKKIKVNIGDMVKEELQSNKSLDWQFTSSKEQLDEGVKSGEYYAGIYIPQNFSKDLLSFTKGVINKPELEYSVNQKINAIAPKITDKGASSIQETITQEFIKTSSTKVIEVLNDVGFELDENINSITKVKELVLYMDENMSSLDGYTKQLKNINKQFPKIEAKYQKAKELFDYMPEIDAAGNKIVSLNKDYPEYLKKASVILQVQKDIPLIEKTGQQIHTVNKDFDKIASTMTNGLKLAEQSLEILDDLEKIIPDINKLVDSSNAMLALSDEQVSQIKEALPIFEKNTKSMLEILSASLDNGSSIVKSLLVIINEDNLYASKDRIIKALDSLEDLTNKNIKLVDNNIEALQVWDDATDSVSLANSINELKTIKKQLQQTSKDVSNAKTSVKNASNATQIKNAINTLADQYQDLSNAIDNFNVNSIIKDLDKVLDKLSSDINSAQNIVGTIKNIDLTKLIKNTKTTISSGVKILKEYEKQLPILKKQVAEADKILNNNMKDIIKGINKASALYTDKGKVVQDKLSLASTFILNDWPKVKTELYNASDKIDANLPLAKEALHLADNVIDENWDDVKTGVKKAAKAIKAGEKDYDLSEVIKLLKSDATKESDFLSSPVELNTKELYAIPNYGSASTPFYTALCLWVGALLFSSIATTRVHIDKKDKTKYSNREKFTARGLTFITVGVVQALVASIGDMIFLNVYVYNPIWFVVFSILISLVFMSIIYSLVALFGNVGKGIAIIILVLSISGGGGNFPIELSGGFFTFINPLLPFTYAVNLLREAVGGILWTVAIKNIIILIIFGLIFLLAAVLLYPKITKKVANLSKKVAASHLLH